MQNLQPLRRLRRQLYQGTPIEVCADLQPLSHLTVPAPLTQGSLYEANANLQPLSRLCQQLYQGTPTYVAAIIPFPLHSEAYRSLYRPHSAALTNASHV